jgi:amino acid adenylation domain-containing protein
MSVSLKRPFHELFESLPSSVYSDQSRHTNLPSFGHYLIAELPNDFGGWQDFYDLVEFALATEYSKVNMQQVKMYREKFPYLPDGEQARQLIMREISREFSSSDSVQIRVLVLDFIGGVNYLLICGSTGIQASLVQKIATVLCDEYWQKTIAKSATEHILEKHTTSNFPVSRSVRKSTIGSNVTTTANRYVELRSTSIQGHPHDLMTALFIVFKQWDPDIAANVFVADETQSNAVCPSNSVQFKYVSQLVDEAITCRDLQEMLIQNSQLHTIEESGPEGVVQKNYSSNKRVPRSMREQQIACILLGEIIAPPIFNTGVRVNYTFTQTFVCRQSNGESFLSYIYDKNIVDPFLATLIFDSIVEVSAQIAGNSKLTLSELQIFEHNIKTEAEISTLTVNRLEKTVEEMADIQPDSVAISCDSRHLTYGELNCQSNRWSHGLIALGVAPGDTVGLCLERDESMLIAMIAVLKAGAIFVPIDPNAPLERNRLISEDANLKLCLMSSENGNCPLNLVSCLLNQLTILSEELPYTNPNIPNVDSTAPAYIIFTSGSTGRPKGVTVPHKNVQALIAATIPEFQLCKQDVWSIFHSFSFDFSVWEIWGPLLTGARTVIVSNVIARDNEAFIRLLNEQKVTVLSQTPSAFYQLSQTESNCPIDKHLRLIIFGGEPLNTKSLLPWLNRHHEQECQLYNMYGITETTVHVTVKRITRKESLASSRSVGIPLQGWELYIMDPNGRPLPDGVPGEIYVGGHGVANGYVNRPDLTISRFIKHPISNSVLYKSGDKGLRLPSGELVHLGRIDQQIKLRGYRIELDEIRMKVLEVSDVLDAAVCFSQSDHTDSATGRIDTFVVMNKENLIAVKEHLGKVLPHYMIPSAIHAIEKIPITTNGKLDQKYFRELIASRDPEKLEQTQFYAESSIQSNTPSTEEGLRALEDELIKVWSELFKTPVKPSDNFFDLGGNSLLAIRMLRNMKARGLPQFHPQQLYINQSISSIVDSIVASKS